VDSKQQRVCILVIFERFLHFDFKDVFLINSAEI